MKRIKVKKFVMTVYGIAKVLGEIGFNRDEFYRLELSENSLCPGQLIVVYPKELTQELEDH